jgi:hypothetical protein
MGERPVTPGWTIVHIGVERDGFLLEGVDPWSRDWHNYGEAKVVVAHPAYPHQRHDMWVSEIRDGDRRIRFAAGEFSNGVWGFFVPDSRSS